MGSYWNTGRKAQSPIQRIEEKAERTPGGCLLWHGSRGRMAITDPTTKRITAVPLARDLAYEALVGPIPDAHRVVTTCGSAKCVNPWHLALQSDATDARESLLRRFEAHVEKGAGCWGWTGATKGGGYGVMRVGSKSARRMTGAYRVAYELFIGPIPEGLTIDHLCRNPNCVRPDHLEPVTQSVNTQRAWEARRADRGAA